MSRREERARMAREAAAKDKKRLILFGGGLILCIAILVMIKQTSSGEDPAAPTGPGVQGVMSLPPVDKDELKSVEDATTAQRVILEPEPFRGLAALSFGLTDAHLSMLGDPAFPFAEGEARSEELRGEPFTMRGQLIEAEVRERVSGKAPEFWTLVETDAGEQFFFASLSVPETLFGSENYVLAVGYFFKYYTQTIGGERVTAPLLVGRELIASYPEEGPVAAPDTVRLASIKDPEMGTIGSLDERGLWHLLNVSRTLRAQEDGVEAAFADCATLDDELLEALVQSPEAFRGAPMLLGGMVRGTTGFERLGENPLRMPRMETAWLRNNSSSIDTLLRVCAPEGFDFNDPPGAVQMHGWFLQLYSYEDREGNLRRAPVFIVADLEGVRGEPPPWAGDVLWGFIGLSVVLATVMVILVRRDKARSAEWDAARRAKRRGQQQQG